MNTRHLKIMVWCFGLCLIFEAKAQYLTPIDLNWYNNLRIDLGDKTNDSEIELMEIIQQKGMFLYFQNQANFKRTDTNNNIKLSKKELNSNFTREINFLEKKWQVQLNKLLENYSQEQLHDATYLKNNFGLLKQLVGNNIWLKENETLLKTIFDDTEWAKKHKAIIHAFSNNILFFVQQGSKALTWYKNPKMTEGSTNFMRLRNEHIRHLSQQQQFKKVKKAL